jgi:hypothetical protein
LFSTLEKKNQQEEINEKLVKKKQHTKLAKDEK